MSASKRPKILIVDDEVGIRELLSEILIDEGYLALTADTAEAAWEVRRRERLALILLDIWMPGKDGLTLLKQWQDADLTGVPIIVMSGHATIDTAVSAMKLGAHEILEKPIATNRLLITLQKVINSNEAIHGSPEIAHTNFGKTSVMRQFKSSLLEASASTKPILFIGPPNAGAMFYAQMLAPAKGPVIYIDRNSQLEYETDQILSRASGGLIVVRLIDMLNAAQQGGLLALIREAERVGARVVAAAIASLKYLKDEKKFNPTLLDELSYNIISQPPLLQYMEDIPYTLDIITHRIAEVDGVENRRLVSSAVELLQNHRYENDFLELLALVRRALMYSPTAKVDAQTVQVIIEHFALGMAPAAKVDGNIFTLPFRDARALFEREYFRRLFDIARGDIQMATELSGLERTYLYRKIKNLGQESQ